MKSQARRRGSAESGVTCAGSLTKSKVLLWLLTLCFVIYVCSASKMYKKLGKGLCGDILMSCSSISSIHCAAICNQKFGCNSFSFADPLSLSGFGACDLHLNADTPDGQGNITCFVSGDWQGTSAASSPSTSAATTAASVATTVATTAAAITTTVATTAAAITTTVATTAAAITTTTATASATVTPVDVSQLNSFSDLSTTQPCGGNVGAVGIFEDNGKFQLICKNAPNGYSFQAGDPPTQCVGNQMGCMSKTCPSESVIRGFLLQNGVPSGPCSGPRVETKLSTDCHTISGTMQPRPSNKATWVQWRLCGGSAFYVMTAASVSSSGSSWNLDSITCCLVLP